MKRLMLIVLSLYVIMSFDSQAQDYSYQTINEIEGTSSGYTYGAGGYAIASTGSLKVLIIFAEFPDDGYDITNTRWVKGNTPQNMSNWVDATWSSSPTQGSLTHYFNVMSLNNLHITGETMHVIAPRTRQQYKDLDMQRGEIQREILQSIDATKDFSSFDQWKRASYYTHVNQPETPVGQVDMIIFIWRNISSDSNNPDYKSELDFTSSFGDLGRIGSFTIDNGARTINTGTFGSGITVSSYVGSGVYFDDPFRIAVHEFAHYLLGYNDMHNGYGFWGMLCDWGTRSYVVNAFERYQLGWINSPDSYTIDANTTSESTLTYKTLDDFVTNGHAYRITIDASTQKYFYLENHQNISYWETHSPFSSHPNSVDGNIEAGFYVVRQIGMTNTYNYLGELTKFSKELIPADGRYTWDVVCSLLNPFGGTTIYPEFYKEAPNRTTGYNDLEMITHSYNYSGIKNPSDVAFVRDTINHTYLYPRYFLGDGKDAFRIGYNQVFSPWSNPNNQRAASQTTPFGFEITNLSNGVYTLNIYVNTAINGSPSKPQNLIVSAYYEEAVLNWQANTEPDMQNGGKYKIYRSEVYGTGDPVYWDLVANIDAYSGSTPITTWTDPDASIKINPRWLHYKIVAVDNTNLESVASNITSINGKIPKRAIEQENQEVNISFNLVQNYPNPFNPSSTIAYSIAEKGFVSLKVYDILGNEIAELVNNYMEKGNYQVKFDGSKLSSGIYFCKLTAGYNNSIKKMLLIK